ncbi:ATP-dependent Clp protease ATP-binding subunit ClpC [Flavobacterium cutihirudinis]|uniref:ATP-dependent Clp protease ATP-binding subunit ClpC n=1 Tax=Flavobacterium cutihirudinis TaxID=1265740 RepID=A0A3D9FYU9_9FLAO|nr:AAA family ATPase [Flavobacterium cutihirudinis]RED26151.1 ATP-dependent Clp protease ATP-binding subunit ClpC [Flavobacterium cutihirudinis]
MRLELLFYEKDDFFDYRELKYSEGYSIISVSKFIKDNELIYEVDPETEIIDLSVLSEYVSLQLLPEQILPLFDDEIIFIADKKHKKLLSYELRFLFKDFKDVEKSYLNKEVNLENDSNEIPKKRHTKIIDLDDESIEVFFQSFREKLYGHPKFKDDLKEEINTFRIFNKLGEHKILSLFLMGDSGVGKTEVARTMFNCLDGKKKLAKINFGNYSNEFSLSSLIGSARGYTGSDDGEIFMKVRDTDVGILLIDEFEKSNASLFNYFLDVLESGKMTSSLGDEIDLNGFIIIFTSNISKEDFSKRISPELRSRFNYKCMFTVLSNKDKEKYIEFRVGSLIKKVKQEYNIEFPDNTINYFVKLIDVSKYKNMRDINKQIKKVFLKYIEDNNYIDIEHEEVQSASKFAVGRKIISLFR